MKKIVLSFRASKEDKSLIERESRRRKTTVSNVILSLWQDFKEYRKLWYDKKNYARTLFNIKLKAGKVKKLNCCLCGDSETEAHHIDYSSPLIVTWLCKKCHKKVHLNNKDSFGIK